MTGTATLDQLRLGDHVCWTFDDDQHRIRTTAGYVSAGLDAGHKILYVTSTLSPAEVLDGFRQYGVEVGAPLATGQLRVSTADEMYLAGGSFDAQAMIDCLAQESTQARVEGYAGLRTCGDMGWAVREIDGVEQIGWYESQVNRVFADGFTMAVCVYDRRLFSPTRLRELGSAHPSVAGPDADADWTPLLRITWTRCPVGLRLDGELDLSNRAALRGVLSHLVQDAGHHERGTGHLVQDAGHHERGAGHHVQDAGHPDRSGCDPATLPLVLDLSGLSFADGAAVRMLSAAATSAQGRIRITGCTRPLARLLGMHGAAPVVDTTVEPVPQPVPGLDVSDGSYPYGPGWTI